MEQESEMSEPKRHGGPLTGVRVVDLTAMVFGYKEKANFTVENEKEIAKPPSVNFDSAPAANQSSTPRITK